MSHLKKNQFIFLKMCSKINKLLTLFKNIFLHSQRRINLMLSFLKIAWYLCLWSDPRLGTHIQSIRWWDRFRSSPRPVPNMLLPRLQLYAWLVPICLHIFASSHYHPRQNYWLHNWPHTHTSGLGTFHMHLNFPRSDGFGSGSYLWNPVLVSFNRLWTG